MKRDDVGIICVRTLLLNALLSLAAVAADPTAAAGVARIELPPCGRVALAMPFDAATSGCPSTVTLLGWDGPGQCYADRDGTWTPRAGEGFFALNRGTATVQAAWAGRLPDDAREMPFWTQLTLAGQPAPAGASSNGWRHPIGGTVTSLVPGVGYWHSAASNGTWRLPGPNGRSQLDLAVLPPCAADDPVVVRVAGAPGDSIRLHAQDVLADANGVGAVEPWTQVSAGILGEDGTWMFEDRAAPIGTDGATAVRLYAAEKSVADAVVSPGSGAMRTTCVTGSFSRVRIRTSIDGVAPAKGRLALYVHADPLLSGAPALSLTKALPARWPTDWTSSDRRLAGLPVRTWWIVHLDANANGLIDADEAAAFATLSGVSGGEAQLEATLSLAFPFRNGTTATAVEDPMTASAQRTAASDPPPGGGGSCFWSAVGDYDGDGYDNKGMVRKSDYVWSIWTTNGTIATNAYGYGGCLPVSGDYDGDSKMDKAVVSTNTWSWHLLRSSAGNTVLTFGFGGCKPVPADYDGDGTTDVAVIDSAFTWYIMRSRDGFMTYAFGYNGCVPVPADYDGDGKADIAVLDKTSYNWFLMRSRDGFKTESFGYSNTEPRPGDYDGDGKADLCIAHKTSGLWHFRLSSCAAGTDATRTHPYFGIAAPGRFDSRDRLSPRVLLENCPYSASWLGTLAPLFDYDNDGLEDSFEIRVIKAGLAATIQQVGPNDDPDGDGMINAEEEAYPGCDPGKRDTDGDGLTDREEVLRYHTDPAVADTDGDGIVDSADSPNCGRAVATFAIEQDSLPNTIYVKDAQFSNTKVYGYLSSMTSCSEQQFQSGLGTADQTYEADASHHENSAETYVTAWRTGPNTIRLHVDTHMDSNGGTKERVGRIRFNRARVETASSVYHEGEGTVPHIDTSAGTVSWRVQPDAAGNGGYADYEIGYTYMYEFEQAKYFSRDTFYVPWQNSGSTNLSGPRFRLSCAPTVGLTWSVSGLAGVTIDPYTGILSFGANTQPGTATVQVSGYVNGSQWIDSMKLVLLRVGMTAYRPTTEGPAYNNPFQRREIPEAQEETPGAGIRVNGDDDNVNSTPDRNDTTVNNENDLIEVVLDAAPTAPASGFKYVLKRSSSNIKVWNSQTKGTAWLDANDETNLTFSTTPMTVWVENPNGGAADLELQAKTDSGTVVCSDKVHFYPFTSVVIVFGGEFQDTVTDPPPAGAMIYSVATRLFQDGYDAHMYEEPDGDDPVNTEDTVFDEIVSAVNARQVTAVAVLGYSHGGGSTWRVADRLNTRQPPIGLQFSAYVDAVTQDAITQETRRPPGSAYHANYYQEGSVADGGLDGGPIDNPPGANHQVNLDDPTATETHTTIDDEPAVLDDIVQRLSGQVNR